MPIIRALNHSIFYLLILFVLSGCATMNLDYEKPNIELISFKVLPAKGFEQNFEIGLKLTNPNNFELPFNGVSYQLNIAGEKLAHGVAASIPTAAAYGESRFVVPISTSLLDGFSVVRAIMKSKGQDISYQLKAKLDIDIPFMPKLTVLKDGIIPLGE